VEKTSDALEDPASMWTAVAKRSGDTALPKAAGKMGINPGQRSKAPAHGLKFAFVDASIISQKRNQKVLTNT
jgi:hypothetical protein